VWEAQGRNAHLTEIFQKGENNLNKYCNVANALDPTGNHASTLFEKYVTFAVSKNYQNPYFPLDTNAKDTTKLWLTDAMKNLIIAVLTNDPKVNQDVRSQLSDDLKKLQETYNLNQATDAKTQAAEIIATTGELLANMAMYMSTIIAGFQEMGKLAGFGAAAAVVNKVLNSTSGRMVMMKGVFTVVVVSIRIPPKIRFKSSLLPIPLLNALYRLRSTPFPPTTP
jgi:hypothetical protein